MKKLLIILAIVIVALLIFWPSSSSDTEYKGTVKDVNGNVVELVSGLKVRLIGVEPNRTDVEMFIKNNFVGKNVTVVFDSKGDQEITSLEDTVGAYLVLDETDWSINHLCAIEYEDAYVPSELTDSLDWVGARVEPEKKKDLALYMKQRTFLIATSEGTGTGFFINADGLAMTNWHVLSEDEEGQAIAVLYKENPDDSEIYRDKKRNIKNILWTENTDGMDISIFSVELENNEKVPYFNLARKKATVGSLCATFGNPLGYTASYSAGHISAFRDEERGKRTVNLMQYEMSTNPGNSGGPVCDEYGQIIAVHELGNKAAQGINFGIDIMQLRPILDDLGFKYGGK